MRRDRRPKKIGGIKRKRDWKLRCGVRGLVSGSLVGGTSDQRHELATAYGGALILLFRFRHLGCERRAPIVGKADAGQKNEVISFLIPA
ncbi:hypothetical protein J2R78_001777 [Bradyrhizobium sp. USDA 4538]|nr:hypothetical protein [Bradyrhizobium sp. USDA 4538]MCP1899377.1 hypothetical protein [Bradyrhizobium sp. USDA 4537]MCP1986512.1 hypothetical protein [Bradyrhizobium sp. USDA 4539]